jgi:hypothetical protein
MGAGRQRWWRDFVQECAQWTDTPAAKDYRLIEARSESGIVCKVALYTWHPMYYGIVKL